MDNIKESLSELNKMTGSFHSGILNAYLDQSLDVQERSTVEDEIGQNVDFKNEYRKKLLEREFIFDLIPKVEFKRDQRENIFSELEDVYEIVFGKNKKNIFQKVWTFLNTPII